MKADLPVKTTIFYLADESDVQPCVTDSYSYNCSCFSRETISDSRETISDSRETISGIDYLLLGYNILNDYSLEYEMETGFAVISFATENTH